MTADGLPEKPSELLDRSLSDEVLYVIVREKIKKI